MIVDSFQREQALDPKRSFIVQAPAGSGKTELLTQRFLKLLSITERAPEEILAVTFTRKAAAQMRQRILQALQFANDNPEPPTLAHERKTWDLARAVLARNQEQDWQLQVNPNRLRIVTIDALCTYIVNKMPVLSNIGAMPSLVNDPRPLYQKAVETLLTQTTQKEPWVDALKQLLHHMDNRVGKLSQLLVQLLAKRDQWLLYLSHLQQDQTALQAYFQECLTRIVVEHLEQLQAALLETDVDQLLALLDYAAEQSQCGEIENAIADCLGLQELPEASIAGLGQWMGIAELLLTRSGEFRKRYTEKEGFPAKSKAKDKGEQQRRDAYKQQMLDYVATCAEQDGLLFLLNELRILPPVEPNAQQMLILASLGELLPVLVALLRVVFQEEGQVDFTEISLRALEALQDELAPTDVALFLDHQLRHLLIDEYQDTSVIQNRLFAKLISQWQADEGRTLFLVGDPMQSIYRFRGAEVSLFLQTQANGLGPIALTPLRLEVNFRSQPSIIDWINQHFTQLFPKAANSQLGAVPYYPSQSPQKPANAVGVHLHPLEKTAFGDPQTDKIMQIIQEARAHNRGAHVAVLVRTRKQLLAIIQRLRGESLAFVAHEVEQLAQRSSVIDILSLLKALLDWTDRVAWLALLRSPMVGLSLADLWSLTRHDPQALLWINCQQFAEIAGLSHHAQTMLARVVPILHHAIAERERQDVSQWLRSVWLALGGPYAYEGNTHLDDIQQVLVLIEHHFHLGSITAFEQLQSKLAQTFTDISSTATGGEGIIELMTIHKAKGLEFDVVILPQLQSRPRAKDKELLLWLARNHRAGFDLLLAVHRSQQADNCPLYHYTEQQMRYKDDYESVRLFYVAATRAKQQLHLLGNYQKNAEGEIVRPPNGSFMHLLWPQMQARIEPIQDAPSQDAPLRQMLAFKRLPADWKLPLELDQVLTSSLQMPQAQDNNRPEPLDYVAQTSGIVFHRFMQRLVEDKRNLQTLSFSEFQLPFRLALQRKGLYGERLNTALGILEQGFQQLQNDPKAAWLFDPNHTEQRCEWSLSVNTAKGIKTYVLDYAFVDQNGVRWIIDYKLTSGDLNEQIERYRGQLLNYRRIVKQLENRIVRCGLYFPLTMTWWELHEESSEQQISRSHLL